MTPFAIKRFKSILAIISILMSCSTTQGCYRKITEKGANKPMETNYIGRFSIAVPKEMKQIIRSSKLRSVEITEVVWPKDLSPEQARNAEWEQFMAKVRRLTPKKGSDKVIIKTNDFPTVEKWTKGLFFQDKKYSYKEGVWKLLVDTGQVGVWLTGDPTIVEKENISHKMINNIDTISKAYQSLDLKNLKGQQPGNRFYLQHGVINLPYFVREESIARFEGHPLDLTLLIEMEMDFNHKIEPMGLITKTRGMLAAALVTPGGSISKVRLGKREVAGMPGEEAVLKVRENKDTNLVFTWEYNGKDDSGEYPTTRINMESPDGNIEEKLKIWDAVLDSMKPMFERKK